MEIQPKVVLQHLNHQRVRSLQEWLRQPASHDFRRLLRSKLSVATIEAGQKLVSAHEEPTDADAAKELADEAFFLTRCLALIEQAASGRKGDIDEPFEYFDAVISVPSTATRTQNDTTL